MKAPPRIVDLAWGRVEVEESDGEVRRYKDAKLWPGGSRAWDWNETGTSHSPGVQPADVDELVEHGAEVVVVGCGVHGRLGVSDETRRSLAGRGVELVVLATPDAAERYGELRRGSRPVGALLHSTC